MKILIDDHARVLDEAPCASLAIALDNGRSLLLYELTPADVRMLKAFIAMLDAPEPTTVRH